MGVFEYSRKGLGHALQHASELVKTYGHHGACCTCVGEAGHKEDVKNAGRFARTYADHNETQDGMLDYVQRQQTWESVIELNEQQIDDFMSAEQQSAEEANAEAADDEEPVAPQVVAESNLANILHKLREPLHNFTHGWSDMVPVDGRPPRRWGAKFFSKRLLITRNELLTLMRTKLRMEPTWRSITLLATQVHWKCYGVAELDGDASTHRKIVGMSRISNGRRDFVRLKGNDPVDGAALSAQVFHVYVTFTSHLLSRIRNIVITFTSYCYHVYVILLSRLRHIVITYTSYCFHVNVRYKCSCKSLGFNTQVSLFQIFLRVHTIIHVIPTWSPLHLFAGCLLTTTRLHEMNNSVRCVRLRSISITHCGLFRKHTFNDDTSPIDCLRNSFICFLVEIVTRNAVMLSHTNTRCMIWYTLNQFRVI